ncbi:MAG: flavodoxin [Firmicutes bacterium]|uniref:Flavodoxin n=1 Tax=Candidatus Onthovivens merdipullorum TaxID=2840889 RepID=A0A9D9DIW7_9BACL|nr:flavodoxin [Candidatus Onthovivens merdipullorum]
MNKLIIYESIHHQNTYKLCKHLKDKYNFDLISIDELDKDTFNFNNYDLIGLASGIYGFEYSKEIIDLLNSGSIRNKKVFILYTSAMDKDSFSKKIIEVVSTNNKVIGVYHCKGYCTFSFFKWFGGVNKNRPNESDIKLLDSFIENILKSNDL